MSARLTFLRSVVGPVSLLAFPEDTFDWSRANAASPPAFVAQLSRIHLGSPAGSHVVMSRDLIRRSIEAAIDGRIECST